jgi:hypothetical protein
MVRLPGVAEIVKFGDVTVTRMLTECDSEPLVPVTMTVYDPGGVDDEVHTISVAVADPPGGTDNVDELIVVVRPEELLEEVRDTVPLKLPMPVTVIDEVAQEPAGIPRLPGTAETLKSAVEETIVKLTVTERDRLPLTPVTGTLYGPVVVWDVVEIVSVAFADALAVTVTLMGFIESE